MSPRLLTLLCLVATRTLAQSTEGGPAPAPEPAADATFEEMLTLDRELRDVVVSASQVSEPIREAPVPVTLITRGVIVLVGLA